MTAFDSGSFFKKTVELKDWWLTKLPETQYAAANDDDDTPVIGVAGLTFTYQKNRPRCFHSAPILEVQDYVELETVDGVFVILSGFINKQRTLENGFSPQVFDHFIFGFPLNWKEFATSCPERSAAKCVARGLVFSPHEDRKDSIKGHADFHDRSPSKSQQGDIYTVDMEVQDCEDTILNNKTTTVCNASSYETPQEHIVKAGHEVPSERLPMTSEFEADSSLWASPIGRKAADSSTAFKRTTRSMTKVDISQTNSPLLNDIPNLNEIPLIEQNVDDTRNKLTFHIGISSQRKGMDAGVSSESQIGIRKCDLRPKRYKSDCSDPFTNTSVGVGSLVKASTEDSNFASSVIAEIDDAVPLSTNMKACQNKEKGQEGVASKDEIGYKKVITRSKSRSNLKSGSSCCGSPKKQLITSPKTRSQATKASKDKGRNEYILSPESFGGKKSRSGRVLLPSLEFWRNQRVVYDEDGEVCGVKERV